MNSASPDARYLATLQQHWRRNKAFPAMAKLAHVLGLRSSASVFGVVGRLSQAGYLERVDGRLAPTKAFFSYRLLGTVRAGVPQEAPHDADEVLSAEDFLVQHPDRTSYATVRGDSMTGIGLLDGDIVVVEHNTPTRPGDIVVAVVDDRITVKTLVLEGGEYILRAENPDYEDIRPGHSLEVLGVVVGSFRRMKR
jgi:SOS regulatory protein LexA